MAREYYSKGRIRASYETYKKHRIRLMRQGYEMYEKVSLEEYIKNYNNLKLRGKKNIAEYLAKGDRKMTGDEARKFHKIAKESGVVLPEEMQTVKGLYSNVSKLLKGEWKGEAVEWVSTAQALYMAIKNQLGAGKADEAFGY